MDGPGWTRWFLRDGQLRAGWRVLLFVALFGRLLLPKRRDSASNISLSSGKSFSTPLLAVKSTPSFRA